MRNTQTCGGTHQELRVQATPHHHRYFLFTMVTTTQSSETYQEMISYICPLFYRKKEKTCIICVFGCDDFVRNVCLSRKCVISKCRDWIWTFLGWFQLREKRKTRKENFVYWLLSTWKNALNVTIFKKRELGADNVAVHFSGIISTSHFLGCYFFSWLKLKCEEP